MILPKVGIVIIDSRSKTNKDWVEECISSIQSQYYRDIDCVVINNTERLFTIGKCRNQGVMQLDKDCKWVLFVDDDDWISPDYVLSLLLFAESQNEEVNRVSSGCFFIYDDEIEYRADAPIGMWRKDWLEQNKFDETLTKYEDVLLAKSLKKDGTAIARYIVGYFYRQHNNQNSGKKLKRTEPYKIEQKNIKEDVKCLAKEIDQIFQKKIKTG